MEEANVALTETPYLLLELLQSEVSVHNPIQIVGLPRVIIAFRLGMLPFLSMDLMDVVFPKAVRKCR